MFTLEMVVGDIGGSRLQISKNRFLGLLDSDVPQEEAAAFPESEVGCLG
jgi:hypothetical protein